MLRKEIISKEKYSQGGEYTEYKKYSWGRNILREDIKGNRGMNNSEGKCSEWRRAENKFDW